MLSGLTDGGPYCRAVHPGEKEVGENLSPARAPGLWPVDILYSQSAGVEREQSGVSGPLRGQR